MGELSLRPVVDSVDYLDPPLTLEWVGGAEALRDNTDSTYVRFYGLDAENGANVTYPAAAIPAGARVPAGLDSAGQPGVAVWFEWRGKVEPIPDYTGDPKQSRATHVYDVGGIWGGSFASYIEPADGWVTSFTYQSHAGEPGNATGRDLPFVVLASDAVYPRILAGLSSKIVSEGQRVHLWLSEMTMHLAWSGASGLAPLRQDLCRDDSRVGRVWPFSSQQDSLRRLGGYY